MFCLYWYIEADVILWLVQVQGQVKRRKGKFDRLKLDTMQKIDLLAASRSNMFSQVLVKYQSSMLNFWEKMSYRMTAVADSFKGYQYYEFNMLKVNFTVDWYKFYIIDSSLLMFLPCEAARLAQS